MRTSHALLLRIWHDPACELRLAIVEYTDRGAPGDTSVVGGGFIRKLERDWFLIDTKKGTKTVPYHRIKKITYEGISLWEQGM